MESIHRTWAGRTGCSIRYKNFDLKPYFKEGRGCRTEGTFRNPQDFDVNKGFLRRLRLKGLLFRPPRTNRYFVTPYGWKVARWLSRLEARVFRPAVAMFTGNAAVLPFPLRASLDRVDAPLDELVYQAFPQAKAS